MVTVKVTSHQEGKAVLKLYKRDPFNPDSISSEVSDADKLPSQKQPVLMGMFLFGLILHW